MGGNLAELFRRLVQLGDDEIAKMHPAHDVASVKSLLPRLHYFQEGTCIVHHLFGGEVIPTSPPLSRSEVLTRAERKSRSRETALSKTDVMLLRLLLPHERFCSSLVFATIATSSSLGTLKAAPWG